MPHLRLLVILATLLLASPLLAQDQTINLQDHLGRAWKNQLLSYPLSTPQPGPMTLTGPKGNLPTQISGNTIWFITDLAPLAKDTYKLSPASPAIKTDIQAFTHSEAIILQNSHLNLTFPTSDSAPLFTLHEKSSNITVSARLHGNAVLLKRSTKLTASGSVFAQALITLTYENNVTLKIQITLIASDPVARIQETVENGDLPDSGWDLVFDPASAPTTVTGFNKGRANLANIPPSKSGTLDLNKEPPGTILSLQPWQDWWATRSMVTWDMGTTQNPHLLTIASADPGLWVPAGPPGSFGSNANYERKLIRLEKNDKNALYLRCNAAAGSRAWLIGASGPRVGTRLNTVKNLTLDWPAPLDNHPRLFLTKADLAAMARSPKPLNTTALNHFIANAKLFRGEPHGTSDTAAITAYVMSGMDKSVAKDTRLVERLENHLNIIALADKPPLAHKLASPQNPEKAVDLFRDCNVITTLYDVAMYGDLLTEPQKRLARARLAYLAYLLNDPQTWSTSRGYKTGNVNMSVGYAMNAGLIACALPDHPDALQWIQATADKNQLSMPYLETFLQKLGPDGEFPESVSNYLHVTVTPMFAFAVALRNANLTDSHGTPFHDYVADPRMLKLVEYATLQFTPPDPRLNKTSVRPASGRGNALHSEGLAGLVAKATAATNPTLSQEMQWHWLRTGPSYNLTHHPLGGLEDFYLDPALPAKAPDPATASRFFRDVAAVFKHAQGTKHEFYLNLLMIAGDNYVDWYPSESGGFPAIYARGVPISVRFAEGYAAREELLISRVLPAKSSDPAGRKAFYHAPPANPQGHDSHGQFLAFSTLPLQDYAAVTTTMARPVSPPPGLKTLPNKLPAWPAPIGKPTLPITWTRQVLFIKSTTTDPSAPSYFLLRDTINENQPTMWQFWTLSTSIVPTAQATQTAPTEKLPDAPAPAKELFGDRFTALGQFGVDTDFFIASPLPAQSSPRHTLRYGNTHPQFAALAEYQDLLHIQMPGSGAYVVAIVPRDRASKPPAFERMADNTILKISGDFGTDYVHVSFPQKPASDPARNISFNTAAGSIRDRPNQTSLSLATPGSITFKNITLESPAPATLTITPTAITITTPTNTPNQTITYTLPNQPKQTITTTQSQTTLQNNQPQK